MHGRHCHYCKRELHHPESRSRTAATRDHIVPQHMGGRRTVPCCRQCNQLKGPLNIDQWADVMRQFPDWWRRFEHRGQLIEAQRQQAWRHAKREQQGANT